MEAWMMPAGDVADQRAENRQSPNVPVTIEQLRELGVLTWTFDPKTMLVNGDDGKCRIDHLMEEQEYKNRDECVISPKMENYDAKLTMFYTEHIHEDDEIRLLADGTGYFDVRGLDDKWIRVAMGAGDLIVLPAGMYHRYTPDNKNYTHAVRLFKDAPKWTAINRDGPADTLQARKDYVAEFVTSPAAKVTALGVANATDNVYVHHPETFDRVLKTLVRGMPVDSTDLIVIYLTGTHNPVTKKSWCPDCVVSDPFVKAGIEQLRAAGRKVALVQCAVERSSFLNKPEGFYRVHPFAQLKSVPTLMVLTAKQAAEEEEEKGVDVAVRLDGDVPSVEWAAKFIK